MADGIIQVPIDGIGKKVDAASLDVGVNTVYRQRVVIGDNSASAQFAIVTGGALLTTGTFNISATASVVIAAGTANIGAVSNAPGTALMGAVSLAAGTANIGFVNHISASVNCVITGFRDNSGNTIQIIDSANIAIRVAGYGTLGSIPIGGFIDASGQNRNVVDSSNLSLRVTIANATATVTVVTANPWAVNIPSASHGPITVTRSTSATATLIVAPGAGLHIYVTGLTITNAGTALTTAQIGVSASLSQVLVALGANGGSSVMQFDPPWKAQSNEAVLCRVDPAPTGNCYIVVNFFVGT